MSVHSAFETKRADPAVSRATSEAEGADDGRLVGSIFAELVMTSRIIESVLSGVSDRRATNFRYRQGQFISLHSWIVNHLDELLEAVCETNAASLDEAKFLITATLNHLRALYESLGLKEELTLEYNVQKGHNSPERRIPRELAYLIPERYNVLSSVINTIPDTLTAETTILKKCIVEALDGATVGVVSSRPGEEFLHKCFKIDQTGRAELGSVPALWSGSNLCAVAIVDRTADVNTAAGEIFHANTFFSGRGPYAPDLILVNEFVEDELINQLHALSLQSKPKTSDDNSKANGKLDARPRAEKLRPRMFISEKMSANFDIKSPVHREASAIPVVAVTSLDCAIDFLLNAYPKGISALYLFGTPAQTKYLGQFIPARVNFINYIPATLLAPEGYPLHPTLRYRREMMEIPSPQFFQDEESSITSISSAWKAGDSMYEKAIQPLKPDGQPIAGEINFFLQGFLASFVVYMVPLLTAIVGGGIYAIKLTRY
ncbi:hypothetical protein CFAM422_006583 [Trichoderma lentiforme]|uniref:Aldehyde dehydrogenase domain-containing protein n=1 Tax=Trichoderma lentiforme TaxID=1567552 RepID=A0A9P5CCZ9_9HYPO|nr:hypothetical protein CFAM422_006583 [Trichoderma lentiforme]